MPLPYDVTDALGIALCDLLRGESRGHERTITGKPWGADNLVVLHESPVLWMIESGQQFDQARFSRTVAAANLVNNTLDIEEISFDQDRERVVLLKLVASLP